MNNPTTVTRGARRCTFGAILALAPAAAAGTYSIPWHSCDGGGGASSGGAFKLTGTVGQPDAATHAAGGAFCLAGGVWSIDADPCEIGATCVADLNHDGIVNGLDLGLLLSDWAGAGIGDLNDDGLVDGGDLGMLLGAWGPC